ncbi:MAG: hypothetical protein PHO28_03115 [Candidatus Pacebacteria bacterium]|nr:hypothetical protein [Candidatus Paceibacterota bacterium]
MSKITDIMQNLIMSNPKRAIWFMTSMKPDFWEKQGENLALKTFHEAAEKVPAYKDFISKHGIKDHTKIKTIDDFKKYVPLMDKDNYLRAYPLEDTALGDVTKSFALISSAGTTGKPLSILVPKNYLKTVYPGMLALYDYFWNISENKNKRVLMICAMALGVWAGGTITPFGIKEICDRFENFTLVNTGTDPAQIVNCLKTIGKHYEIITVFTYPSFLKLLLDYGDKENIKWEDYNIKVLCSSELIDFNLWNYFINKLHPKSKDQWCILDTYSMTETAGGTFATPFTIEVKKIAQENESISYKIFQQKNSFGLFQFNPAGGLMESINNEIIITYSGKIPLIRYNIKDLGKIFSWQEMNEVLKNNGVNIQKELRKDGWTKPNFQWPFLTILGRKDYAISLYGAKISPETIQFIFNQDPKIYNFKLTTSIIDNLNPHFGIFIELQPSVELSENEKTKMENYYSEKIVNYLLQNNFDFKDAYSINKEVMIPKIKIFPYRKGPFQEDIGHIKLKQVINN